MWGIITTVLSTKRTHPLAVTSFLLLHFFFRAASLWGQLVALPWVEIRPLGVCSDLAGWTGFDNRVIAINPDCPLTDPGFLEALMTHEYGHLLCLCSDHNDDPSSIMNPVVVAGNQITEDDKWRVRRP